MHPAHLFIHATICVTLAVIGFQKASSFYSVMLGNLQKKAGNFRCRHSEKKTCQYLQKGRVVKLSDDDLSQCGKATVADSYLAVNATSLSSPVACLVRLN